MVVDKSSVGPIIHTSKFMIKLNIPYHKQIAPFTCGPACILMALKYFNRKLKVNRALEWEIWRESYLLTVPGGYPQGLAYSALKRGVRATIICKKRGMFECSPEIVGTKMKNSIKEYINIAKEASKDLFKKANSLGVDVIYRDPTLNDLKDAINNNRVPLVLIWRGGTPHWVVIIGFDENKIYMHDPKRGKIFFSVKTFVKRWDMLKEKVKIEKRILILSMKKHINPTKKYYEAKSKKERTI